jgi:hypothetical protein
VIDGWINNDYEADEGSERTVTRFGFIRVIRFSFEILFLFDGNRLLTLFSEINLSLSFDGDIRLVVYLFMLPVGVLEIGEYSDDVEWFIE